MSASINQLTFRPQHSNIGSSSVPQRKKIDRHVVGHSRRMLTQRLPWRPTACQERRHFRKTQRNVYIPMVMTRETFELRQPKDTAKNQRSLYKADYFFTSKCEENDKRKRQVWRRLCCVTSTSRHPLMSFCRHITTYKVVSYYLLRLLHNIHKRNMITTNRYNLITTRIIKRQNHN